jgi:hypothetical protein
LKDLPTDVGQGTIEFASTDEGQPLELAQPVLGRAQEAKISWFIVRRVPGTHRTNLETRRAHAQ